MSYKKCPSCKGAGTKVDEKGNFSPCTECAGKGVVPTNRIMYGALESSRLKMRKIQFN